MKAKFRAIWQVSLALVLAFSLIGIIPQATPVQAANGSLYGTLYLASDGTGGAADWSTTQKKFDAYSVALAAGTDGGASYGQVWKPVNIPLADITDISFWYYLSSTSQADYSAWPVYKQEGQTYSDDTGYVSPYVTLEISDGTNTHWVVSQPFARDPDNGSWTAGWEQWSMSDNATEYPSGSGNDPTEALWHDESFNDNASTGGSGAYPAGWEYLSFFKTTYSGYNVVKLKIAMGSWAFTTDQTTYVDDIAVTASTTTYAIEPRVFIGTTPYGAIQTAVNAASSGDTINVAAGTYEEGIIVNKKLTLQGADGAIIDCSDPSKEAFGDYTDIGTRPVVVNIFAEDVTVSGFTIKVGGDYGIGNCGIDVNPGSTNAQLLSNTVESNDLGIHGYLAGALIQENTIDADVAGLILCDAEGATVQGNLIKNANVYDWSHGVYTDKTADYTVTFVNNTFQNNSPIQVWDAAEVLDIGQILENNTFDRAVTIDRPGDSLLHTIWSSIQDAIDAATSGDTVTVAAGTYNLTAPVVVNKAVTLTGNTANPANVVVNALDIPGTDRDCFQVVHDDVTIQGFKMINAITYTPIHWSASEGPLNAGIMVGDWSSDLIANPPYKNIANLSGFDFSYNIFDTCSYGIYFYASSNATISYNTFTDILPRMGGSDWVWDGIPIILINTNYDKAHDAADQNLISNVTVCNNVISGGCRDAIHVESDTYCPPPQQSYITDITIEDNDISGAGSGYTPAIPGSGLGIALVSLPYSEGGVSDVTHVIMTNVNIKNNNIHENVKGVSVWASTGLDDFSMAGIHVNSNNICSNTEFGTSVSGDTTGTLDATMNWWGALLGPKHVTTNPASTGDSVSDNVNYTPWRDAGYPDGGNPRDHNVLNTNTSAKFNSIGLAIAAGGTLNGHTLSVLPGTYKENVTVNKALTVESSTGSDNTTIAPAGGEFAVAITSDNVTFGVSGSDLGFTITNTAGSGIRLAANNVKIDSNKITGNSADGIVLSGNENRVRRNTISNNQRGIYFLSNQIATWNQVEYNDITGNTDYGAYADQKPGEPYWMQYAGFNYWGNVSGPAGTGPGEGDKVNQYVWYNPWLNASYSTILASGIADISMAIPLQTGWNTLSTPLALAGDSNQWSEIVTRSSLTYAAAVTYDASSRTFVPLFTDSTDVLSPLDGVFIKVTSPALVCFKVSTAVNAPPTKQLVASWNLIGSAMSITERELEMWKVLVSVDKTPAGLIGYTTVVSPPLATQPPWVYVRGQETVTGFEWQKMDFGRAYWIYMENADEFAGFASTPITARVWD